MPEITDVEYEEYQNLKNYHRREIILESLNGVSYLEDDIDTPIKNCVAAFALLGCQPVWSCCGFYYKGQPIHKHHQYGRCYFILENNDATQMVLFMMSKVNFSHRSVWEFQYKGNTIDLHCDITNVIKQWDVKDCIHYSESGAVYIASLQAFLMSMSDRFSESVALVDTNNTYKEQVSAWQYPPKDPWGITKEWLMEETIPEKIWRLGEELTNAIEEAIKYGYRVDVRLKTYSMFGWKNQFTIIQADIYRGVIKKNL